ncbi:MAG TPA: cyclic nucleotide-binding domain-containing protein [Gammaproteobacteria bacterium]|nr:cyclic nucleotide-binding domain-containing protein [Gammaproteobacteria bacterium]
MNLLELFDKSEETVQFDAGAVIFSERQQGNLMYVVLDGEVEIRVNNELLDLVKPGEVFGEMALVDSKRRSATAIARAPSRLEALDEEKFLAMVRREPQFAIVVMRILARRLRKMNLLFYG